MAKACEICSTLAQCTGALVTSRHSGLLHVVVECRLLELCREHADEVCNQRLNKLKDLYAYYLEPFPGQRSLVPRRGRPRELASAPRSPGRRARDGAQS